LLLISFAAKVQQTEVHYVQIKYKSIKFSNVLTGTPTPTASKGEGASDKTFINVLYM
jgi:hypothetical protein